MKTTYALVNFSRIGTGAERHRTVMLGHNVER